MPPRTQALLPQEALERLYYEERLSIAAIAAKFGTNVRLVRDSFTAHGLTWRTRAEASTGKTKSPETRLKIGQKRLGHKDTPEVAAGKRDVLRRVCSWSKGLTARSDPRVARQATAAAAAMRTPEYRERRSILTARLVATGQSTHPR